MKDLIGRSLSVGDGVAMCVPHYKHLIVGTVSKVTPKGATIEWNNKQSGLRKEYTPRLSEQLIKL